MFNLLFALATAAAPVSEPLEPAKLGQAQCQQPDVLFRTCASLAYYVQNGPSSYMIRTVMLIDPAGPVVLETRAPVQLKGKAVCGFVRWDDLNNGIVTVAGRELTRNQAVPVLARFFKRFSAVRDKEICTQYEPTAQGMLKAKPAIAGTRRPELDYPILWVKPSDGYAVAP